MFYPFCFFLTFLALRLYFIDKHFEIFFRHLDVVDSISFTGMPAEL